MERKLAAILAADIVGYSAQMERDEAGTFARLSERRKGIFEPEIARHGGRIFKTMGDGILAEFGSVVQAVECAVVLQAALEERNRDVPDDQAIRARIGINLGEVIVDGDDRFGEGVNIAARPEQLAETGGICVSDKVAREVEKKLAFGFVPMGPQKVKNIAEPVEAFRVSRETGPSRRRKSGRPGWPVMAAALAVLAACLAAVFILKPWATPRPDGPPVLGWRCRTAC
jgi:class 3 adenylate cyclase